jgi:hypothetical protein
MKKGPSVAQHWRSYLSRRVALLLSKANITGSFFCQFLFLIVPFPEAGSMTYCILALHHQQRRICFAQPDRCRCSATVSPAHYRPWDRSCRGMRRRSVHAGFVHYGVSSQGTFSARPWGKWVLAAAVVPIGILRNGFRILTISWLTVNVDRGSLTVLSTRPVLLFSSLVPLLDY